MGTSAELKKIGYGGDIYRLEKEDGTPFLVPGKATDFRDCTRVIRGGQPPHKEGSTGFVYDGIREVYVKVEGATIDDL
jgi:hypothetical protein